MQRLRFYMQELTWLPDDSPLIPYMRKQVNQTEMQWEWQAALLGGSVVPDWAGEWCSCVRVVLAA